MFVLPEMFLILSILALGLDDYRLCERYINTIQNMGRKIDVMEIRQWRILARAQALLGKYDDAEATQGKIIASKGYSSYTKMDPKLLVLLQSSYDLSDAL